MRQLYLVGRELRSKYVGDGKLLPNNIDPTLVYAQSTNTDRAVQSL
jgi:hypothetical protein